MTVRVLLSPIVSSFVLNRRFQASFVLGDAEAELSKEAMAKAATDILTHGDVDNDGKMDFPVRNTAV